MGGDRGRGQRVDNAWTLATVAMLIVSIVQVPGAEPNYFGVGAMERGSHNDLGLTEGVIIVYAIYVS